MRPQPNPVPSPLARPLPQPGGGIAVISEREKGLRYTILRIYPEALP